jgi:hypothetical protein
MQGAINLAEYRGDEVLEINSSWRPAESRNTTAARSSFLIKAPNSDTPMKRISEATYKMKWLICWQITYIVKVG